MNLLYEATYSKLILESENSRPGVLCTVVGPAMEIDVVNNNNRIYSREVITDRILTPKTKDLMEKKMLLGEPSHPEGERFDVDISLVSHSITHLWIEEKTNTLMARLDILDTPNGRILESLIRYGSVLGISARSAGESKRNKDGHEVIIPNSYIFKTFDVVMSPGFKKARVNLSESESDFNLENLVEQYDLEQLKSLKCILEASNENYEDLIHLIDDKVKKANSIPTEDISNLRDRNSVLEDENTRLKYKLAEYELDKCDYEVEIDAVQDKVLESELEIDNLTNQLREKEFDLLTETERTKDALSKVKTITKRYEQEMKDLKTNHLQDISKLHEGYSHKLETLNEVKDKVVDKLLEFENFNKELKLELADKKEKIKNLSNQLINKSEENTFLLESINNLKLKCSDLKDNNMILESERDRKSRVVETTPEIEVLSIITESEDIEPKNNRVVSLIKNTRGVK